MDPKTENKVELPVDIIRHVMGYSDEYLKYATLSTKYHFELKYITRRKKFVETLQFEMMKNEYQKKNDGWDFSRYWTLYSRNAQQLLALRPLYEKTYPNKNFLQYVNSFRGNTMPQAVEAIEEYIELVGPLTWFSMRHNTITASGIAAFL